MLSCDDFGDFLWVLGRLYMGRAISPDLRKQILVMILSASSCLSWSGALFYCEGEHEHTFPAALSQPMAGVLFHTKVAVVSGLANERDCVC